MAEAHAARSAIELGLPANASPLVTPHARSAFASVLDADSSTTHHAPPFLITAHGEVGECRRAVRPEAFAVLATKPSSASLALLARVQGNLHNAPR